jgi:hypothetical protein
VRVHRRQLFWKRWLYCLPGGDILDRYRVAKCLSVFAMPGWDVLASSGKHRLQHLPDLPGWGVSDGHWYAGHFLLHSLFSWNFLILEWGQPVQRVPVLPGWDLFGSHWGWF